ncbi:MAG: gamma-glutamylcyclotransferase family protein [Pirellulaceae bacterium]
MTIEHIFVYGTLKTSQIRESCWPSKPLSVRPAWTRGQLYDLGPDPAMILPESTSPLDRVAGEVWTYSVEHLPLVLHVLDQIEVTNQPGEPNEYNRQLVDVFLIETTAQFDREPSPIQAHTYIFAHQEQLLAAQRVQPTLHSSANMWMMSWPTAHC